MVTDVSMCVHMFLCVYALVPSVYDCVYADRCHYVCTHVLVCVLCAYVHARVCFRSL